MSLRHTEFLALINQIHQLRHGTPITNLHRLCDAMWVKTMNDPMTIPCFCGQSEIATIEVANNTWWISDRDALFVVAHIMGLENFS